MKLTRLPKSLLCNFSNTPMEGTLAVPGLVRSVFKFRILTFRLSMFNLQLACQADVVN